MQRIKIHLTKQKQTKKGVTIQTTNTQKSNVKWEACVYYVQIVLPLQTIFMPTDSDPWTKHLQSLAFNPDGWKQWQTTGY